jgi:hypothetical protein
VGVESHVAFIKAHARELSCFWQHVKAQISEWKHAYEWPRRVKYEDAFAKRADLEQNIKSALERRGYLAKDLFDEILVWGFGRPSACSAEEIEASTSRGFDRLRVGSIAEAAGELTALPGVGISRASKILALSDQLEFGIYDSRAAHGLSDLVMPNGCRVVPIPPGRVIQGDWGRDYCRAFEQYTWVLRQLRTFASDDPSLRAEFRRVADIEMAFFMRSRLGAVGPIDSPSEVPRRTLQEEEADHDEESLLWTLGSNKTRFWFTSDDSSVTVWTGKDGTTSKRLRLSDLDECLRHFAARDWFFLSNSKTPEDRDPDGLGEYFASRFGNSVFASHFAALWVHQHLMVCNASKKKLKLKVARTSIGT